VENAVPQSVADEAKAEGVSVHTVLARRIRNPWENRLVAADWWNGSRNTPCNLGLRGAILGLSMDTKPEAIYLTLLQAIVCGTREIIEQCVSYGITVSRILATGGITGKNPTLMQEYANLLNLPVYVGQFAEGPALGAAMFAAVAAGVHSNVQKAYDCMGISDYALYEPDTAHREQYEALYRRNHALRCMAAALETI